MSNTKIISPPRLFYVVIFYIFASYMWWTYLLSDKNMKAFEAIAEKEQLLFNIANQYPLEDKTYFSTTHFADLDKKFNRQKWMIRGEGLVFMVLLALGAWQLTRTFSKEIALARQQNNFLLSITHELKSPMAAIKLSLQTINRWAGMEDKYKKLATNAVADVDRLETLVDNILLASKIEARSYLYSFEEANVSKFVQDLALKAQQYYGVNWTFETDIQQGVWMKMDAAPFTSAIWNLIENAVKYSGDSRTIRISLSINEGMAQIAVADQGIGIAASEKSKVFQKFYRVGNELTRTAKGTGLGLFIVQRVVRQHKGEVVVQDNTPAGSIFTIQVPATLRAEQPQPKSIIEETV
jgi:signal transduction histidine kinase